MRSTIFLSLVLVIGVAIMTSASAQQEPTGTTITIEALAERMIQAESALTARMRAFRPIVEVYVQNVEPHQRLGTVPIKDEYFLGQFYWTDQEGPKLRPLTADRMGMSGWLARPFTLQLKPDGFAAMTAPDWRLLHASRYTFTYVRREFLGEVRCLVLDVQPRVDGRDGFTGRIWVEEVDYNIVRFNGISRGLPGSTLAGKKYWFNVDSWRTNPLPGIWLPSYVYAEMEQESDKASGGPRFKSQIRLWGYDLKSVKPPQEFTTIEIGEPTVRDAEPASQLSPTISHRMWEQQAEDNVLDRLSKAGLLAPPGEVDKVLETVAKNLQITNNLTLEPEPRVRVLLTSPLDSFTVGRTIVMSRGLIDVLPDEASLATMLAHELAHMVLGHRVIDPKFAFADRLMVPDDELLATVRYQHLLRDEQAADTKVIEMLSNSPYKDKLADAGLFMRAVMENSVRLKNLIQPHIARREGDDRQLPRLTELIEKSPTLAPEQLDQIAALPLGARVAVDPWTSRVELLKAPTVPLSSAREKASLAVTPLVPYLRYADRRVSSSGLH